MTLYNACRKSFTKDYKKVTKDYQRLRWWLMTLYNACRKSLTKDYKKITKDYQRLRWWLMTLYDAYRFSIPGWQLDHRRLDHRRLGKVLLRTTKRLPKIKMMTDDIIQWWRWWRQWWRPSGHWQSQCPHLLRRRAEGRHHCRHHRHHCIMSSVIISIFGNLL